MSGNNTGSPAERGAVVMNFKLGSPTRIECIDLVSDLWDDYLHHLAQSRVAEAKGDIYMRNCSIRSAIEKLISHWDGVVCDLEDHLIMASIGYEKYQRMRTNGRCLRDKGADLRRFARDRHGARIPYISLRLKALRDIAIHPMAVKKDPLAVKKDPIGAEAMLSARDLYDLTPDLVEYDGRKISSWLRKVCDAFGYPRFVDTRARVQTFCEALGGDADAILMI